MADKPSRALVIYGDGLARSIDPSHTISILLLLELAVSSCLFLTLLLQESVCICKNLDRLTGSNRGNNLLQKCKIAETEDARIVREFTELVDANEAYLALNGEEPSKIQHEEKHVATISERFMGMKAAVVTENLRLKSFCHKLGFTVLELNEVISCINNQVDSSALASELFKLLGFQEGKTLESSLVEEMLFNLGFSFCLTEEIP